jgi:hypothetical protein
VSEKERTASTVRGSFLAEGFRELRRKWARNRLRSEIHRQEGERVAALTALGQRAWDEKIDLAAFPELRDQLAGLDTRAGEISATTARLDTQRASLEADKRSELEKFGARRSAVEERKAPVDDALRTTRASKSAAEQAVRQAEARVASIAGKLAGLDREIAAATTPPERLAAAQAERAKLAAEQADLAAAAVRERARLPELVAEETRLAAESSQHASQLAVIDAEKKAAIGHIDGELARLRKESQAASQQAGAVQKDRSGSLAGLGQALYAAKIRSPSLADANARVAAIDQARAQSESALEASAAQSGTVEGGTMAKFWLVLAGVPVLLAAVGFGALQYSRRPQAAPEPVAAAQPAIDPNSCARPGPAQGHGVKIDESCNRIEGDFVEGRLHGKGRIERKDGERMEGRFYNGIQEGPGLRVYADRRRVESFFYDGLPVGQGRLTMPDGTVYEGLLWGPVINGFAVRRSPDGQVVAGQWRSIYDSDSKMRPFGPMLRVRPDGQREKVDASIVDPDVPPPPAESPDAPKDKRHLY